VNVKATLIRRVDDSGFYKNVSEALAKSPAEYSRPMAYKDQYEKGGRVMKKILSCIIVLLALCAFVSPTPADGSPRGKQLFEEHCSVCHPKGGNIIKPEMSLHKEERAEHNIKTAEDIISKMRNPDPGMPTFDKHVIPDEDAKEIADYILNTF
jgi:cytochrome c6